MAIFQFHMQIIGRSEGRSAVAAAAYRSAQKIENSYTGNTEDYTKKKWVEHSEIMLPQNAPQEFLDRSFLWNSVEKAEKGRKARLAREIEVALPVELSMEENIRLVQGFVQDTFLSDGMVADVNIHNPPVTDADKIPIDQHGNRVKEEKDMVFRNPHAHILLTVRPLDQYGNWMPKTQKEYLCKRGGETQAFTANEFKKARSDGWEKQYQYWKGKQKLWLTPSEAYIENLVRASKEARSTLYGRRDPRIDYWNSQDAVFAYRKSWGQHVNRALERAGCPERIDCRSYQDQGSNAIPSLHLGSHTSRNPNSDRYRINENIKSLNQANRDIRKTLDVLELKIKEKREAFYEELAEQFGRLEAGLSSAQYSMDMLSFQYERLEKEQKQTGKSIQRIQDAQKKCQVKDQQASEKIALLKNELTDSASVRGRESIQKSIQAEQDAVLFRKQRLDKILEEEGFSSFQEFEESVQAYHQREKDWQELSSRLASLEQKMQDYTRRYEELCRYLPKDASSMEQLLHRKNDWNRLYRNKSIDHIRKEQEQVHMPTFLLATHKTERTLNHIFYVTGRTQYLLSRMKEFADEQGEDNRQRRL